MIYSSMLILLYFMTIMFDSFSILHKVLPDKPLVRTETADTTLKLTQDEEDKGEDERSKTAYSGKPARAVGVAHPFNAENKSDSEFALGIVGNITSGKYISLFSSLSCCALQLSCT